jgi:phosphatidate cytidylyltransferase
MVKDKINLIKNFLNKFSFLENMTNTQKRIISAFLMVPFALYAIFYSKDLFVFLAIALTILMTMEWLEMTKQMPNKKQWHIIGFFYILIPIYATIKVRFFDADILFWMFAIIWTTDIFAFFCGKALGGKKLAPSISPNKTISGLVGALIACALIGLVSSLMFAGSAIFFIIVSILLSLIEQASDLLESKFKRIFGVKDSGNIIPGHGGVLDRMDGIMLTAPCVLFLISFFPSQFFG